MLAITEPSTGRPATLRQIRRPFLRRDDRCLSDSREKALENVQAAPRWDFVVWSRETKRWKPAMPMPIKLLPLPVTRTRWDWVSRTIHCSPDIASSFSGSTKIARHEKETEPNRRLVDLFRRTSRMSQTSTGAAFRLPVMGLPDNPSPQDWRAARDRPSKPDGDLRTRPAWSVLPTFHFDQELFFHRCYRLSFLGLRLCRTESSSTETNFVIATIHNREPWGVNDVEYAGPPPLCLVGVYLKWR